MNLQGVQKTWDRLGKQNPTRFMLDGKVRAVEDLFILGEKDTDDLMAYIKYLGIDVRREKAVDFGCGLGRMTQALAKYFDEVYGVDIAPSLLELANKYNRQGSKCKYVLNETSDLRIFEDQSIDFVWSYGTLQLIEPRYLKGYLREFLRVLTPGGLIVFQLPAEAALTLKGIIFRITPVRLFNVYRRAKYGFEIYAMKQRSVVDIIEAAGGNVLHVKEDRRTPGKNWIGFQYYVSKELTANYGRR